MTHYMLLASYHEGLHATSYDWPNSISAAELDGMGSPTALRNACANAYTTGFTMDRGTWGLILLHVSCALENHTSPTEAYAIAKDSARSTVERTYLDRAISIEFAGSDY